MDHREKENLLQRIIVGKLYGDIEYNDQIIYIIFTDPSPELMLEANYYYNKIYKDLSDGNDILTLEQTYDVLKKDKIWTNKMDNEFNLLPSEIKKLQEEINASNFKKNQQRALIKSLSKGKQKLQELTKIKQQLYPCCLEYLCDQAKKRFIIAKICELDNNCSGLLQNLSFLNKLIVYYYIENNLSEKILRELARSSEWRLLYQKDGLGNLFNHPTTYMTDLQKLLISYSKMYDFAFESTNRPDDSIIENDEKFDSWYLTEVKRIKAEIKSNKIDNEFGKLKGEEVFIISEGNKESIEEVYELNDIVGRSKIAQREKAIKEKGIIRQENLPDVQQDVRMELNRMSMGI